MRLHIVSGAIAVLIGATLARADPLEDAYKAGFEAGKYTGYVEGYADGKTAAENVGSTTAASKEPGIVFPGTQFQTTIAGDNVEVSPDSSIAIIPNKALGEIKTRLGKDFITDNKIQLNNRLEP